MTRSDSDQFTSLCDFIAVKMTDIQLGYASATDNLLRGQSAGCVPGVDD